VRKTGIGFGYLQVKASRYVKVGPEIYWRHDFFHRPEAGMHEEDLAVLMHDMRQLADGVDAAPDRPFIGIRGFNDMRHTLHLELDGQEIVGETDTGFLGRCTAATSSRTR
jgi:hypothetical protein